MRFPIIRSILQNSMFIRLMACFLLIIIISSTFYYIAYNFFISNIEQEIVNNSSRAIKYTADKMDEKMQQIKNLLIGISSEKEFTPVINGQITPSAQNRILTMFSEKYKASFDYILQYINDFYILPEDAHRNIITMNTTISSERFFEAFSSNPSYTMEFWLNEMQREFVINYYPTGDFFNYTGYLNEKPVKNNLMPLAFKRNMYSNFIMVVLVDINALCKSVSNFDNFFIVDSGGELLYTYNGDISVSGMKFDIPGSYKKTETGYLFTHASTQGNLKYVTFLPNDKLKQQLNKTNSVFRLIALLSILSSVITSIYLVKIFNNPVKQIVRIIRNSNNETDDIKIFGLNNIRDRIKLIVEDNEVKRSMLENYFIQSSLIGNCSPSNVVIESLKMENYAMICFNVHFKSKFSEISEQTGYGMTLLVEMLRLNIINYFNDSITFQIENDKIISIINVNEDQNDITPIVNDIAARLKSEEEYVFFTITLSKVSSDISKLHEIYNKLFEITKFRKVINSTQILSEDIIKTFSNRYYLSSEQMEQFNNLLQSGHQTDCNEFINDILLYNFKKGVVCFNIQLLCIEIINCCIKTLTKLFYDIPDGFVITDIYTTFNRFTSIDEYIDLCKHYVIEATDYIKKNLKEKDYIIDYITEYVDKHYSDEIYLDLLAEKLGMTNNYISSYFKEKTGTSLNYYLNNFRIKKAIELFESTSLKIKDISDKVGYSNVNTFIRIFKKHIGQTPEGYRKNAI